MARIDSAMDTTFNTQVRRKSKLRHIRPTVRQRRRNLKLENNVLGGFQLVEHGEQSKEQNRKQDTNGELDDVCAVTSKGLNLTLYFYFFTLGSKDCKG